MVPKLAKRGKSFKGASDYLLHDKDRASTSERVAWTEAVNLWSERPEDAWFEMMDTWRERASLKRAAGLPATGRDNKAPVLHLSLSWHPDEQPTAAHMKATALSALKALGLQEHQALMVAHKDEPHPHVHLLINTVHPHTGRTANLGYSQETLSRWAEGYEREHGIIRCEQRVQNNARRQQLREERSATKQREDFGKAAARPAPPAKPYEPVKDQSPSRPLWFEKREILDRMKALRTDQSAEQKDERDLLWQKHQAERATLEKAAKARIETIQKNVREHYRPRWRGLYRDQSAEKRYLGRVASHPFERACYVFSNRDRLAPEGKRMTMRDMASLVVSPKRLMQRVETAHERERQSLARTQHTEQKVMTDRVWSAHRASWHQAVERQQGERTALRAHHAAERAEIGFSQAKADLVAERSATPPGPAPAFTQAREASPAPPPRESRAERYERRMREIKEAQRRRDGPDTFERER